MIGSNKEFKDLDTSGVRIQRRQHFGKQSCEVSKLGTKDTWKNHKVGPAWLTGGHTSPGGKESTLH
jgi:hypothetical protein